MNWACLSQEEENLNNLNLPSSFKKCAPTQAYTDVFLSKKCNGFPIQVITTFQI